MKNFYLLIFLQFFLHTIPAQKASIDTSYVNYFQNTRELPHLHLNKTSFLRGEGIWFQAYVLEQNTKKLHPTSSNLYVSIFDDTGILKDQQLIALKNGIGNGHIDIDSTYIKDSYYLKASTNWMRNFNEDNSFTQKIELISSEKKVSNTSLSEDDYFEFKLFPEGGHILANAISNIGILIKDSNNKGQMVTKGIVKNEEGEIITEFSTNQFGYGSVKVRFEENQKLTFEATLKNGSVIESQTPKVQKYGLTLQVLNNSNDDIAINLITNANSLLYLDGKKYRIFIHNTRVFKSYFFEFNDVDELYSLLYKKTELPSGMNIITVFNENDVPVLERLVFNDSKELYTDITIDKTKKVGDSLEIKLTNNLNDNLFLSASFLPSETKSYKPKHNIHSSILLQPFIKGSIETPQNYFNGKNSSRDLDLLLLTQGWSKYKWDDIFNKPPTNNFDFENGIDITATLNRPLQKKQAVLIYSSDNNLVAQIKPNESPFILKNTFIKKNSKVDFALMSNKNLYAITPGLSYSRSKLYDVFDQTKKEPSFRNELVVSNFKSLSKDVEVLDEAVVKANKRKFDNEVHGSTTMLRGVKMENIMVASGETVLDFLKLKGYQVSSTNTGVSIMPRGIGFFGSRPIQGGSSGGDSSGGSEDGNSIGAGSGGSTGGGGSSDGGSDGGLEFIGRRPVMLVYLDGFDISNSLWLLQSMYLDNVKEVFFGRNPGRIGEEIHIYTLSPSEYTDKNATYSHVKFPIGFATEKEYYAPKYPSFFDNTFKHYGAVYWKPSLSVDSNGVTTFKIPLYLQKELSIFIEGISDSGKLISKHKQISLD